ncbi:MAG: aminoacyl-tRNA hydrolase [Ignavibacteriales bacterium]|nr:aminoacyl-tRNA hydrolase [Ignavibacteriales bacterium]
MNDANLSISNNLAIPLTELRFRSSRSGGPGGQNVNKLETRIELLFDVAHSPSLTTEQRDLILKHLHSKIDTEGILRIVSQESRSQWKNKQDTISKFVLLLRGALKPRKKRLATKPSKSSKKRRVEGKKMRGEKKRSRGKVSSSDD